MENNAYNYYKLLGISPDANHRDIKKAYRALALKYHPDKNNSPKAKEFFQLLSEAYHVLMDDFKRSQYDIRLNPEKNGDVINPSIKRERKSRATRANGNFTQAQPQEEKIYLPPKFARNILFGTGLILGLFMLIFPIVFAIEYSVSSTLFFVVLGFVLTVDSLAGITGYKTMIFYELMHHFRGLRK